MKQFSKMGVVSLAGAALFASGCGDETTNNITEQKTGIIAYESVDELPTCNSTTIGEMALLESTGKIVYCADGEWASLNGKDGVDGIDGVNGKKGEKGDQGDAGTSCSMSALKDKSGYKVVCAGDSVGVILHGDKGETGATGAKGDKGDTGATGAKGDKGDQGETGAKGEPGESCTVQPVKLDAVSDSTTGYNILCGGQKMGYVVNGIDGIGCTLSDDHSGQVFVTCGNEEPTAIFKAMCGKKYYDPEYAQCNDGELEEICDGKILTQGKFCYNKKEYDLCKVFSGLDPIPTKYNPEKEGCVTDFLNQSFVVSTCAFQKDFDYELADLALVEGKIDFQQFEQYDLTANFGTKIYDVTVYFCHDEEIIPLCGNKSYDPTTQYCKESKVTNKLKCGNTYYTEEDKKFCHEGELYDYCGLDVWNPSTQLCIEGEIVAKVKCGENYYNPKEQFCSNGNLYDLCGGENYDPSVKKCESGALVDIPKCGGVEYDPTTKVCVNGKIEDIPLCGGNTYDPTVKFCLNNTLHDLCGGKEYDPSKQFCANNKIYNLCGGQIYTPATQKCQLSSIVDKVGDYEYDTMIDSRDGHVYLTVEIGTQTWMAENLNYRKVFSATDSNSYCYQGYVDDSYCDDYGRLYTWAGALDSNKNSHPGYGKETVVTNKTGVCPSGWHLPTQSEWVTLLSYIATQNGESFTIDNYDGANISKYLKISGSNSTWAGASYDVINAESDLYGFSAIAGGFMEMNVCYNLNEDDRNHYCTSEDDRNLYVAYFNLGDQIKFWTSTQEGSDLAYVIYLYEGQQSVDPTVKIDKYHGAYVRCVKN